MLFDLKKYDGHLRQSDPLFCEMDDVLVDDGTGRMIRLEYLDFDLGDFRNLLQRPTIY